MHQSHCWKRQHMFHNMLNSSSYILVIIKLLKISYLLHGLREVNGGRRSPITRTTAEQASRFGPRLHTVHLRLLTSLHEVVDGLVEN